MMRDCYIAVAVDLQEWQWLDRCPLVSACDTATHKCDNGKPV